jgi:outer membrane receptor for ferrienterochelin and colicins
MAGPNDSINKTEIKRLDQIVVTGTKTEHRLRDVPVETIVITKDDIAKSGAQNVAQILKTVPGMNGSMHDDVFGIYTWNANIRGLSVNDGYALVLVDGQRVVGAGESGGMGEYGIGLNQVPLSMVERVEVVKGSASALYGSDAVAGVVNIITKKKIGTFNAGGSVRFGGYTVNDTKKTQSNGSVTVTKAQYKSLNDSLFRKQLQMSLYMAQRPTERLGYRLDYAYENGEDVNQTLIPSYRHALNVKIDADLADNIKLNIPLGISIYTKEEVKNVAAQTNRNEICYVASPSLTWMPTDAHTLKFNGYGYRWDFVQGYNGSSNGLKTGNFDHYFGGVQHTYLLCDNNTLTSGIEFNRETVDYDVQNYDKKANPTTFISVNRDIDVFSIFSQDEWAILDGKLTMVPGIRFDHHSEFGAQFNPKLALMGKLTKSTTLRGSVGHSFKSPTVRQLYYDNPYLHGTFYIRSNPDLAPEKGMGYSAGVEQFLWKERISLGATWFLNDMKDKVVNIETEDTIDGIPVETYINAQKTRTQGVEATARITFGGFDMTAAYTFTNSENRDLKKKLPYMPEHSGSIIPSYTISKIGMEIGMNIKITGKQYTNEDNSATITSFTTVGANISKKITDKGALFIDADNLFNSDKGQPASWRTGRSFSGGFRFDL